MDFISLFRKHLTFSERYFWEESRVLPEMKVCLLLTILLIYVLIHINCSYYREKKENRNCKYQCWLGGGIIQRNEGWVSLDVGFPIIHLPNLTLRGRRWQ